jgi:hypothetical protein
VERWASSGLTAREYATEIGVNHRTLAYWKYRLPRKPTSRTGAAERQGAGKPVAAKRAAAAPTCVELAPSAVLVASDPIELVTGRREIVRRPVGFDGETQTSDAVA